MDDARKNSLVNTPERLAAFNRILALIPAQTNENGSVIILDINKSSPTRTHNDGQRTAWGLLRSAIEHLRDGGVEGAPGQLTSALVKASLRSAPLAASLGIKTPQFEQLAFISDHTSAHDEAVFLCKRLIEAAQGDMIKSKQILKQRIFVDKLPDEISSTAVRKQMAHSLNSLISAYETCCATLYAEIKNLTPPKPPEQGARFTF